MKYLTMVLLTLILSLPSIAAATEVEIKTTDPVTGAVNEVRIKSMRRIAVSTPDVTVITGQVLISDETVQVLAKEATKSKETTVKEINDG